MCTLMCGVLTAGLCVGGKGWRCICVHIYVWSTYSQAVCVEGGVEAYLCAHLCVEYLLPGCVWGGRVEVYLCARLCVEYLWLG